MKTLFKIFIGCFLAGFFIGKLAFSNQSSEWAGIAILVGVLGFGPLIIERIGK